MMWLADVLTGTRSQGWDERYRRPDAEDNAPDGSFRQRVLDALRGAGVRLTDWHERRRAIHHVNQLNDHLLSDIGITRHQIPEYVRNGGHVRSTESTLTREACVRTGSCTLVAGTDLMDQQCAVEPQDKPCSIDALKRVA